MTTAHINHSAGAIACILKYYDVVQLSLDMPDESAKGYTSGAKANQQRMRNVGVIHLKSKMESMRTQTATNGAKISHKTLSSRYPVKPRA